MLPPFRLSVRSSALLDVAAPVMLTRTQIFAAVVRVNTVVPSDAVALLDPNSEF
jgi:hypothetical protein